MRHRRHAALAVLLALAFALVTRAKDAHADPPARDATTSTRARPHADAAPRRAPPARVPRRTLPAYDTRPPAGPSAGEALLWVPRVALFPAYLVTEYLLRAPIGWVARNVERHRVIERLNPVIHPSPDVTVLPTLLVDLGLIQSRNAFMASGGAYFAWDRALHPMHQIRARVATGGSQYWLASFNDRFAFAPRSFAGARVDFLERSDWRFYGTGPNTRETDQQWFNWGRVDVRTYVQWAQLDHFGVDAAVGLRSDRFDPLQRRMTDQGGRLLQDPKDVGYAFTRLFLDSRTHRAPHASGARIEGLAQYSRDLWVPGRHWLTTELEGSLYLEVMRPGRVLSLRAWGAMTTPLGSEPVPVIDLVTLGGFETMRGWWYGRFRGESAAVFTLSYRYPIWYWLDGTVYVEAGNAFGRNFEGFAPSRLFGSAGLGFRTAVERDLSFDLLLAVGTTRFDEPFAVNAFRLAFGVNRGF